MIQEKFKSKGLDIDFDKCELFPISEDSDNEIQTIKETIYGIKGVQDDLTSLGVPLRRN